MQRVYSCYSNFESGDKSAERAELAQSIPGVTFLRKTSDIANSVPISANRRATSSHFRYYRGWGRIVGLWCTGVQCVQSIPMQCAATGDFPSFVLHLLAPPATLGALAPSCTGRSAAPMLALHQSPINLGLAVLRWLTKLGRLPTRSSYESAERGLPPSSPRRCI